MSNPLAYLEDMLRPNCRLSVTLLVAWGIVMASTMGCSIQKRTHLPGFHVEHRSRPTAKPAANLAHPKDINRQTAEEPMQETLVLTSSPAGDLVALETAEGRAVAGWTMNELETTVATTIAPPDRHPILMHPPGMHTSSSEHLSPEIDLDEARAAAGQEARMSFALGILVPLVGLPTASFSLLGWIVFGLGGLVFILSGFEFNRIAENDAKLASWFETRRRPTIWKKVLLIALAASIFSWLVVGALFLLLW